MRPRVRWYGWVLGLVFVGFLSSPTAWARAQTAISHLPLVQVALWPEYDRDAMLVMYIVHLPEDASLPAELVVRIPARVQAPSAVAVRTAEGRLLNAEHRVEADPESSEWRLVIITATEPIVHIEYYDPALEMDGAARHFVYQWPGHWAVDALTVEVQHPRTGVAVEITPEPTEIEEREGLRYYRLDFGAVEAGQSLTVELTYQNPTGELTSPQMPPAENTAPLSPEVETTSRSGAFVGPWMLAGLGGLLLALAGWLYWRGGGVPARSSRAARRSRKGRRNAREAAPGEARYCPQCGTRARPGDRYCRMCGTPLR